MNENLSEFAKLIAEGKKAKLQEEENKKKNFFEKYNIQKTEIVPFDFIGELSKLKKESEKPIVEVVEEPVPVEPPKTADELLSELAALIQEGKKANGVVFEEQKENIESFVDELVQEIVELKEEEVKIEEVKVEPVKKDLITQTVESITKVAENTNLLSTPEPNKVPSNFKAIEGKLKYLEQWISKISVAGPGSGSYWLNDMGDTDKQSIQNATDGQVLTFSTSIGKWISADPTSNGGNVIVNSTDQLARDTANSAYNQANTVNVIAQSSYDYANTINVNVVSVYNFSNTINVKTDAAFVKANAANVLAQASFDKANNALANTGGTITGDLTVTDSGDSTKGITLSGNRGNIFIGNSSRNARTILSLNTLPNYYSGIQVNRSGAELWFSGADYTEKYVIRRNNSIDAFTINNSTGYVNVTESLVVSGNISVSTNLTVTNNTNVSTLAANTVYSNVFVTNAGYYQFADGTQQTTNAATFGYSTASYSQANSANILAQAAFTKANVANVLAQASFDFGNTTNVTVNAAFSKANVANTLAQAAFDKANTSITTSGGSITGRLNVAYTPATSVGYALQLTASNTIGGTGYADFLQITNTSNGATNPNKSFRLNNVGTIEVLNSVYSNVIFSLTDAGYIAIAQSSAAANGIPINNGIAMANNSYIFDDGNYHITAKTGSIWINSNNGQPVNINTQMPTGVTGGGLNVQGAIRSYAAGSAATSFISGAGAISGVALQMDSGTAGVAAEMSIRDTSTVASTMYFDNSTGSSTTGAFKWRSTSSFTARMDLDDRLTVYTGRNSSVSNYGYLAQSGAGTVGGSSGSVSYGIVASNRIQCPEFDATSDERVKDIQGTIPLEKAVSFVRDVDGILYTWKPGFGDEGLKSGFSAQGVHKAGFEHMIGHVENDNIVGGIDDDGFTHPDKTQLTMGYNQAIPYHHEVIKHLLDRIEQLEDMVAKLTKDKE